HYIRMHRKRTGLSQKELAFLLGWPQGEALASRYERFLHEPTLSTALACEFIFQVPLSELFAGMFDDAALLTVAQMRLLEQKLDAAYPPPRSQARRIAKVDAFLQRRLYFKQSDENIPF